MHPFTPTPLEWRMLADAAAILALEGPPDTMQAYLDLAESCRRNSEYRQPVIE
jgi:hypothetical protein